ncbi:MAG: hypothetical protein EPN82_10890, partial [Bacteroidetes bacterium]
MKKLVFIITYILCSYTSQALSNKFEIKPLIINFRGVEAKNDTIIAFGDYGSMLISYDFANTWKQVKVFDRGIIIKIYWDDTIMTAFNDAGDVARSNDKGLNWHLVTNLNDSILAVIKYPEGYFIRSDSNLKILSDDFTISKEFKLYSMPLGSAYKYEYRKSLVYYKNYLIAAIDSARFLRFDSNLAIVDTIDLKKFISDSSFDSYFQIELDSNYFYTKVGYKIYKTQDFNSAQIVYDSVDNYKLIDGKIYFIKFPRNYYPNKENFTLFLYNVINKDSAEKISELEDTYVTANIRPKDFTIVNNKLIIVGNKKLILTIDLNDNEFKVISDFSGGNFYSLPDIINDSTYLFYDGFYYGELYNELYISENNGLTFKPRVDTKICPEYKNYFYLKLKYFNKIDSVLFFIGSYWPYQDVKAIISHDYGKTFVYSDITEFNFGTSIPSPLIPKLSFFQNIQKINNNYITTSYSYYKKGFTKILIFNNDLDLISKYQDSNYVINYIYAKDTNTFIIHCINTIDSTREIRYTSDKGLSWELIKKYPDADSILYYKEITIDNKPALAMFNFNFIDSNVILEILDFGTRTINKIYSYKETGNDYEVLINNGIFNSNDTIFIAIKDTLFFTNNIYDRSKWKYINFPNNGKIIETFKKYGDTFFARYSDDIHPNNIYWININDLEKPKSMISASDYDFGKKDIKIKDSIKATLEIENFSQDSDLLLTGYSVPGDTVFITDLPKIDTINSLIINPGKYFEFNVIFHPTEVKVYNDSIVFYSN